MRVRAASAAFAAVASISIVSAPAAEAQTIDLSSAAPQSIPIPATVRGGGAPRQETLNFELQNFIPGNNGAVCAIGTLTGGGLPSEGVPVAFPVETATRRSSQGDCNFGGATGALDPKGGAKPARMAVATGAMVQPAAFTLQPLAGLVPAQFPPAPPPGGCNILNLRLGPINLNILGLVIQTNTIVVNVTGIPSGGLLGNLLCALLGP